MKASAVQPPSPPSPPPPASAVGTAQHAPAPRGMAGRLVRLGLGRSIRLSFAVLLVLIALAALAAGLALRQVVALTQQEQIVRVRLDQVEHISHEVSHFVAERDCNTANQVFAHTDQTLQGLHELEHLEVATLGPWLGDMQTSLQDFRVQFQKFAIEMDQKNALEHHVQLLGQAMVEQVSQGRVGTSPAAVTGGAAQPGMEWVAAPGPQGDAAPTYGAAAVLHLQWLSQSLLVPQDEQEPAVLPAMHAQLAALGDLQRQHADSPLALRLHLFRLQRAAREYVGSFEKWWGVHQQLETTGQALHLLAQHLQRSGQTVQERVHLDTRARLWRVQVLLAVALGVSLLCGLWLARLLHRAILHPVHDLAAATQAIGSGNMDVRAAVLADDEIGALARSFNRMAASLAHGQRTLEQRVLERTQALAQVNVQLQDEIRARQQSQEQVWQQANFDALTGLANRRMFQTRLEQEMKSARHYQSRLALLFLDLDRFKDVNDTFGHSQGDALLRQAAQRITDCVAESDMVARLGGDEFTIILTNLADNRRAEQVAQKIQKQLTLPFTLNQGGMERSAYIGASIGVTLFPDDAQSLDMLMNNADQAMYAAKDAGRNRVHFFTPGMQAAAQWRALLAHDLRLAVEQGQLELHLQPIVDLANNEVRKAEALLRWRHPQHGYIGPQEFVPLAEEVGLIVELGDWVFEQALTLVAQLRQHCHPQFQLSINKSPMQFHAHQDAAQHWCARLHACGLPGQALAVEITEGVLLDASDTVHAQLLTYRQHGVQVALDDFGTGYSSLAYLNRFDINYIKIDRSFVRDLTPNSNEYALCEAITIMAHRLGLKVVAEGVETPEQQALLHAMGCDYAQGYWFSKPVPVARFVQRYAAGVQGADQVFAHPLETAKNSV